MTKNKTTYISILRGINVGGHKKIKMDALRQMYSELVYSDVQSYIQSGNVIFSTVETDIHTLGNVISGKILEKFGFEVAVIVLTVDELKNALKNNPFAADTSLDTGRIYLTFLSALPDQTILDAIPPTYYFPDEFKHWNNVIYCYCPTGYGNTKLTNIFFENKLKLTATCRNLNTSKVLLALAEKIV